MSYKERKKGRRIEDDSHPFWNETTKRTGPSPLPPPPSQRLPANEKCCILSPLIESLVGFHINYTLIIALRGNPPLNVQLWSSISKWKVGRGISQSHPRPHLFNRNIKSVCSVSKKGRRIESLKKEGPGNESLIVRANSLNKPTCTALQIHDFECKAVTN